MATIGSLEVSRLCLGANVFGWTADREASFAVLDAFVGAGGTVIDTADSYMWRAPGNSGGESETIIGDWMAARGTLDPSDDPYSFDDGTEGYAEAPVDGDGVTDGSQPGDTDGSEDADSDGTDPDGTGTGGTESASYTETGTSSVRLDDPDGPSETESPSSDAAYHDTSAWE